MSDSHNQLLREMAQVAGVELSYYDSFRGRNCEATIATVAAVLQAMRIDTSTTASLNAALDTGREAVLRRHVPHPGEPQDGVAAAEHQPDKQCFDITRAIGDDRAAGLTANLYTVRARHDWGIGDTATLRQLVPVARRLLVGDRMVHESHEGRGERSNTVSGIPRSVDFIGINPLHDNLNRGDHISPYSPSSRLFRNPIYINVADIPELKDCPEARSYLDNSGVMADLRRAGESNQVLHALIMRHKFEVLRMMHRTFRSSTGTGSERARSFERYKISTPLLDDYAIFCLLADVAGGTAMPTQHIRNWREWPESFRTPGSAALRHFALEHEEQLDMYRFVQFELDRQLGVAQKESRDAGMRIGIYSDLALSSSRDGFDAWRFQDLFVSSASLGAPPDPFAAEGQDWGIPPLNPEILRATNFEYWRLLLRASMAHCGMLRVDHVMGLWRQFWIPEGAKATDGVYVRFPAAELLDILAEESRRAKVIIVGEDLGNVPPEVRPELQRRKMLSSRVMYFERDNSGRVAASLNGERLALLSANTHDLAPVAGWWVGHDIAMRPVDPEFPEQRAQAEEGRAHDRSSLAASLVEGGYLSQHSASELLTIPLFATLDAENKVQMARLVDAVHMMLSQNDAQLCAFSLDDLALEVEPVNLPGVGPDKHRSWVRRMSRTLPEIA